MAKKKRQRISYVLPLASTPGGHRLGVNGLAFDEHASILYSGGRDGVVCAWNVDSDATRSENEFSSSKGTPTSFRSQVQAHTHWINDILLAQNNTALVSASSDVAVKVWRPNGSDASMAHTIGLHSDYVKVLASPHANSNWVASGGLDHKIYTWDLNGGGQNLEIDVRKLDSVEKIKKGSIYALCANGPVLASGGPESVVRLWDTKTGKGITKLVGHTDIIRDILMSDDGDMLLTASSDQTVKVWSMTAGRCMHTLTMHNDSIWSLFSSDPRLRVFYSADRAGLIAKTDSRLAAEFDEGVSVAVCQEHDGVFDFVVAGEDIWSATSSSSINRWKDVDTEQDIETPPRSPRHERSTSSLSRNTQHQAEPAPNTNGYTNGDHPDEHKLPFTSMLRLSVAAPFPARRYQDRDMSIPHKPASIRKASEAILDHDLGIVIPVRGLPSETIEGQNGLIKHSMLNDRKRVLTQDTAGEVVLWDLLKCTPIKHFGRRHLEDVEPEVNNVESIANWCSVDTRSGKLSVTLEENYCFDAEVYADEAEVDGKLDFREDQRINLGKWVLRNLFSSLLDEEIRRDEVYRNSVSPEGKGSLQRSNAPGQISLPTAAAQPLSDSSPGNATTPKANEVNRWPMTPGLAIGMATPSIATTSGAPQSATTVTMATTTEETGTSLSRRTSKQGQPPSTSTEKHSSDYFSATANNGQSEIPSENMKVPVPTTPGEALSAVTSPTSPIDDKEDGKKKGLFGKKFGMAFPKNLGRKSVEVKQLANTEEKHEVESDKSSDKGEKLIEDNFFGVIQKIRQEYDEQIESSPEKPLIMGITPSLPNETPILKPPPHTSIIIQEDNPESGGLADLYRGEISQLDKEADIVEKIAPMWLGELLLRNAMPFKDTVKVSFILLPQPNATHGALPSIASPDGNARLNANRMLRVKKIIGYISERIEDPPNPEDTTAMKPEEYVEVLCNDKIVDPNMTLSTLRVHVWKTGGDVLLYYRANGKKVIKRPHPADSKAPMAEVSDETAAEEEEKK